MLATRPLSRTARAWRAFTLVELLVVMFMTSIFGLIIVQAVGGATATTQQLLNEAHARENAHVAMTTLERALTGARPLGACLDTGSARDEPLGTCHRIGEYSQTAATTP